MAMTNVAYQLALAQQDVVLIDFDLEAPGLTLMPEFRPAKGGAPAVSGGLAAFLAAGLKNEPVPKVKDLCYVPQIQTMANLKGKIHVLPAGDVTGAKSTYDVSGLRLDDLYADMPRSAVLDDLLLQIEEDIAPAYLLVDSRTGLTEIGGICTAHLGQYIVVLFGLNEQNIQGTALMLERLRRVRKDLAEKCILVASPVPQGEEQLKAARIDHARKLLGEALGESAGNVLEALTLPYHPQLALTEANFVARFPDSELAAAYNRITSVLRDANPRDSRRRFDKAVAMMRVNPRQAMELLRAIDDLPKAHGLRAVLLEEGGKTAEADAAFQTALKLDPLNADILGDFAFFLDEHKRFDEAEDYYRRAVEADPKHAHNLGNYATFLAERGRFDEAEDYFRRAIEADPKDANNLGNYAVFLKERERFDEAEGYFRRAVDADPKHANNLGNYALFLDEQKRFNEVEDYYRRAVDADPKHANNLGNYAAFLAERGRFDESEDYYRRAVEADPKHADNLARYATFLARRDHFNEAGDYFRRAVEADPKNPNHLGNYALLLEKRDHLDEAEDYYRRAVEADPKHAHNIGHYAALLAQRGRFDEAEDYFHRAVEADPKHAESLGNYAMFLGQLGRFEEAEDYYRRAIEADPKHANNLGNYATFLAQRDRFDDAEDYYRRAVEADPKHADNLGRYALFLGERKRIDESWDYYRRAVEADPRNAKTLCNYGWLLYEHRGDIEGALRLTEAGLATEANNRLLLLNRGLFLLLLGRIEEARASYEAALLAGGRADAKQLQAGMKDLREAVSKYPQAKGVQEMADWFEDMVAQHFEGNAEAGREGTTPSGKKG
jgi:Tfp pilus assembly protein PilF